jgi:translation elongation factor aEF-1 beta
MSLEALFFPAQNAAKVRLFAAIIADKSLQNINVPCAILKDPINMAHVIVTFRIMLEDNERLPAIQEETQQKIKAFGGNFGKAETQEIAFGIKALLVTCSYDENKGAPDPLEESLAGITGVKSVEAIDVRRSLG